jgi:hypothetical protein
MKSLVTSLAVVAFLVCIFAFTRSLHAQVWCCGGPYDGCPSTQPNCYAAGGTCPTGGMMYGALSDTTVSVFSCVPAGASVCSNNDPWPFCMETGYVGQINGICTGVALCTFYRYVDQCFSSACPP